jgi:hypothetical protein
MPVRTSPQGKMCSDIWGLALGPLARPLARPLSRLPPTQERGPPGAPERQLVLEAQTPPSGSQWSSGALQPFSLSLSLFVFLSLSLCMDGWLARSLAGWMAAWLAGWQAGCLAAWQPGWLAGWMHSWMIDGRRKDGYDRCRRAHLFPFAPPPRPAWGLASKWCCSI